MCARVFHTHTHTHTTSEIDACMHVFVSIGEVQITQDTAFLDK